MEEIALLDLKPLLVNQATRALETAQGRCWLLYWYYGYYNTLTCCSCLETSVSRSPYLVLNGRYCY